MTSKDITAPTGGVMTDEVGTITGDLTLRPDVSAAGDVSLQVQYQGAAEWYRVTGAHIKVDPNNSDAVANAETELLNRF
ncbi:hypothetical protein [Hamadaea tsunoensis]|uniref:hypothetical protein n=1 Tax=Hamadaea tsunoensis TaxID=53368 RepID=UPI00041BBE07